MPKILESHDSIPCKRINFSNGDDMREHVTKPLLNTKEITFKQSRFSTHNNHSNFNVYLLSKLTLPVGQGNRDLATLHRHSAKANHFRVGTVKNVIEQC